MTDSQALSQYAQTRRREDLTLLVERHLNWVHSCALRQVRGDPHLAGDVTQAVFLVLAQKPPRLRDDGALAGWLFRVTRFVAARAIRSEARRRKHEGRAAMLRSEIADEMTEAQWQDVAPMLDDAVSGLSEADRQSLVLRFFQQRTFEQVGRGMGISEEAARKRVSRAVEKLKEKLAAKGVAAPAGLGGGLLAWATQPAPAGVVAAMTTLTEGATASASVVSLAKGVSTMIAMMKAKTVVLVGLAVMLLPTVGIILVAQQQAPRQQASQTPPPATAPASQPAAAFEVRVRDAQGRPIQDAQVYALQRVYPTPNIAVVSISTSGPIRTGADGVVKFPDLPAVASEQGLDRWVYARVPGTLVGANYRSFRGGPAPERDQPMTIGMVPSTTHPGSVAVPEEFSPQNFRARITHFRARSGVAVEMSNEGYLSATDPIYERTWPGLFSVPVGPDGTFALQDLPANGFFGFAVEGPGLAHAYGLITLPAPKGEPIAMTREAVVGGILRYADGSGPSKGVDLRLYSETGSVYRGPYLATTDEQGRFRFTGLREGIYNLGVNAARAEPWTMAVRDQIRLGVAERIEDLDLQLERGTVVTGQVIAQGSNNPVANVMIGAVNPARVSAPILLSVTTDASGKFTLRLPTGTTRLYVMSPGDRHESPRDNGERNVTILPDGTLQGDTIFTVIPSAPAQREGLATVRGRVLDTAGKPVPNIKIGDSTVLKHGSRDMPVSDLNAATTDNQGNFQFKVRGGASHELFISSLDYSGRATPITPAADETVRVDLTAKPTPILSHVIGRVVDPQGKPIADAEIDSHVTSDTAKSDADGRFRLPVRSTEPMGLSVIKAGYELRQWGVGASQESSTFIMHPTARVDHLPRLPLPDSKFVLGNPAPPMTVESWITPADPNNAPQIGKGKRTILMFTTVSDRRGDQIAPLPERIIKLQDAAKRIDAQAIVLFATIDHESRVRDVLKGANITAAVGMDAYVPECVFQMNGATRIGFGGTGWTRVFRIEADGTVVSDQFDLEPTP